MKSRPFSLKSAAGCWETADGSRGKSTVGGVETPLASAAVCRLRSAVSVRRLPSVVCRLNIEFIEHTRSRLLIDKWLLMEAVTKELPCCALGSRVAVESVNGEFGHFFVQFKIARFGERKIDVKPRTRRLVRFLQFVITRRGDSVSDAERFQSLRNFFGCYPLLGIISAFVVNVNDDSGCMDKVFLCPLAVLKQNCRVVIPKEVILIAFGDFSGRSVKVRIPRHTSILFFTCIKFEHVLVVLTV